MALMRGAAQVEEVVQEALLAALAGIDRFSEQSDSLRQLAVRYAEGARVESAGCNTAMNVTRKNGNEDLPESDANDRP